MSLKNKVKAVLTDNCIERLRLARKYTPAELIKDAVANVYLLKASRTKVDKPIRVGFVVQMPEIWDKESPIYEAMLKDRTFEPELIVVPSYDLIKKRVSTEYEDNYFLSHYPDAVKAYEGRGWVDLKQRGYDYTFLQRPYDQYLPKGFRSYDLARFSKVCYIPYGFSGSDVFNAGNTNKAFFRSIYFSFLESDDMVGLLRKQFSLPLGRSLHKVLNLGYPVLIPYFSISRQDSISNILWTPRWSFDPVIGGSNFFKYKDCFIQLAKENDKCTFTFRPHPLMVGELQDKGLMTSAQINAYLDNCSKEGIKYDKGRPILETLCDTSILITDFSSIIIQYYITGRPIIYCDSCIEMNGLYKKLAEGFYIAKDAEDVKSFVKKLVAGDDPLYDTRQRIIQEELLVHKDSTKNIVNCIFRDACSK